MTFLDIPLLNNYKSIIAGYGLMIVGIANLLLVVGNCLSGTLDMAACLAGLHDAFMPLMATFGGLGVIGIRHAIEKAN